MIWTTSHLIWDKGSINLKLKQKQKLQKSAQGADRNHRHLKK